MTWISSLQGLRSSIEGFWQKCEIEDDQDLLEKLGYAYRHKEENPEVFAILIKKLEKNKEKLLNVLKERPNFFQFLSLEFRDDNDCLNAVLFKPPFLLQYAGRNATLDILEKNGLFLEWINEEYKKEKGINLKAVSQNGLALEHVPSSVNGYFDIASAAINQNTMAFQYVPPSTDRYNILRIETIDRSLVGGSWELWKARVRWGKDIDN